MAIEKTRRQIKTEENRAAFLRVAAELFSQYGFDQVTVDAICAEASMSKGSYYNIFKSKEDLLMLVKKTERSEYLKAHFTYEEASPLQTQMETFFLCNLNYLRTGNREQARATYVSYIRTMRGYGVEKTFYHITLNRLIKRGLQENAFTHPWKQETLYAFLHDWIIGLQMGWSIAPDTVDETMYDDMIQGMIRGLLR